MRASHTVSVITLFALTALPSLGQGQVYSWKDASGKIHYGDRPPAERSADSRKLPPAPSATVAPETARKAGAEHEKQQTEAGGSKPPEDPAQVKLREENCRRAKANLAAIESGQARFMTGDKGERIALDGAVRDAEIARAKKNADDWCKPPATK